MYPDARRSREKIDDVAAVRALQNASVMRLGLVFVTALVACGGHISPIPPPPPVEAGSDDAAIDASGEIDGGTSLTSWCAERFPYGVAMCDDFDLRTTPRPEWTTSGSGLVVVESPYSSAPHALHALAAPGTASFLSFSPEKVAIESKFEAEIQITADGTSSTSGDPAILALACEGGQSLSVVIVPGTNDARCSDSGFAGDFTFQEFPFTRGAWHWVVLKISVNQDGTYNPICEVDGVDHGRLTAAAVSAPLGTMTAIAGFSATTSAAIDAYYDNVADDVMQ